MGGGGAREERGSWRGGGYQRGEAYVEPPNGLERGHERWLTRWGKAAANGRAVANINISNSSKRQQQQRHQARLRRKGVGWGGGGHDSRAGAGESEGSRDERRT